MITIDPEFKALIPPLSTEELHQLEANILQDGCRDPLVVWNGILVDGHNRFKICTGNDIPFETKEYDFDSRDDAKVWIIDNQLGRRNLPVARLVELNLQKSSILALKEQAKQNLKTPTGGKARRTLTCQTSDKSQQPDLIEVTPSPTKPHIQPVDVKREVAKASGVSHDTVAKVKKVLEKAPEPVKEKMRSGEVSINEAYKGVRALEKAEKKAEITEQIKAEPTPTPQGPFRVIAIDPPWKYDNRSEDATHRSRNQYPDMTVEEICALPVSDLAHDDCIMWLWTTNAFMRESFTCLDAWGFTPKTILTWDKVNIGLGDWLRNVTEHCILATKGKPIVNLTNQTTIITEKRREHSRKPDAFYALVESLCPGSRLEMFARAQREGWAAWGAETDKFQ